MARRFAIIGLFMVLPFWAMGCHWRHCHQKHAWRHQTPYMGYPAYADPGACCCSSPASIEPPVIPTNVVPSGEPLPAPKRMPSTTMTPNPMLTGLTK